MTLTRERPPAGPAAHRFGAARRVLKDLSVGTMSLLVLVSAGLYTAYTPIDAFALSAPVAATSPSSVRVVYGKITDRFNRPLQATVRATTRGRRPVVGRSVITQTDGTYRIELPGPGKYRLSVSTQGVSGNRNFTLKKVSALQINAVKKRRAGFSVGPISSY